MADYYKTEASVAEYIQMARDVNGGQLIDQLKQFLPSDARVLELGSGPGTDWELLTKTYQTTGSDNSREFLKHLRQANPDGNFLELDAVTLETDEKFDAIYSSKVMHHLRDEELLLSIERQAEVLNPEGIICHSFWYGEGSEIFKGLYVNYHNEKALKKYFSSHFDLLLTKKYAEFETGDSLLMIARQK